MNKQTEGTLKLRNLRKQFNDVKIEIAKNSLTDVRKEIGKQFLVAANSLLALGFKKKLELNVDDVNKSRIQYSLRLSLGYPCLKVNAELKPSLRTCQCLSNLEEFKVQIEEFEEYLIEVKRALKGLAFCERQARASLALSVLRTHKSGKEFLASRTPLKKLPMPIEPEL